MNWLIKETTVILKKFILVKLRDAEMTQRI